MICQKLYYDNWCKYYCLLFQLADEKCKNGKRKEIIKRRKKESFEDVSLFTKIITQIGFYILMIVGTINQLLFEPNVARERNRKVHKIIIYNFNLIILMLLYNYFNIINRDMLQCMIVMRHFICVMFIEE